MSHLPINDVEEGLKHIDDKYHFEDDNTQKFKNEFIQYIEDFWIRGCLPPPVWNCFGRSEDLTNNNQEGYNSRINKELKETHPSPGVLLCHVRAQIILAEEKLIAIKAGLKNPAQRVKYKELAKRRMNMKKDYLESRRLNEKNTLGEFLSAMGYNVASAVMAGRTTDYEETHSQVSYRNDETHETSNWVPAFENSVLEEFENENNIYAHRKIGVKEPVKWKNKKCPSCSSGFNNKSFPLKCDGCDSYTHKKPSCLSKAIQNSQFYWKTCNPATNANIEQNDKEVQPSMSKVDTGFKCEKCGLVTSTKYSMKRHIERKHGLSEEDMEEEHESEITVTEEANTTK